MARSDRQAWCRWYWSDWFDDEGVQAMSFDQQGRYVRVLGFLYRKRPPGVATESEIRGWACYSMAEWQEHREAFARCFKIAAGKWTQSRVKRETEAWLKTSEINAENGRRGAAVTNGNIEGTSATAEQVAAASPPDSPGQSPPVSPPPRDLQIPDTPEETDPPEDPETPETRTRKHSSAAQTWERRFPEFWDAYPHHGTRSKRQKALARWMALTGKGDQLFAAIMAGLAACKASDDWTREGGRFVPGAQVWIGDRGWDASNGVEATPAADDDHGRVRWMTPDQLREARDA